MATGKASMEDIPLSETPIRERDYTLADATLRTAPSPQSAAPLPGGGADDTASDDTNSSDEFDWSEPDEDGKGGAGGDGRKGKSRARRGRALWLGFMRLARPVRVTLVLLLGCGVLITPLLVFQFRFKSSVAHQHVFAWSLWFSIIWAAACLTHIIADGFPRLFIRILDLFGGKVENLKTQVELIMAVSAWVKLALSISWAWIALSVIRTIYTPPGNYWPVINRVMQALFAAGLLLLVEKLFVRLTAINFHQKALADRLAENRLGLKALDRLSNATPAATASASHRKPPGPGANGHPYGKGHKAGRSSGLLGLGIGGGAKNGEGSSSSSPVGEKPTGGMRDRRRAGKARRKKAMAAVIVDQLGAAVGQVALKDSRFNKGQDFSNLQTARKLARKLFETLNNTYPPRSHLLVDDFEPYFHTTAEAHAAFEIFDKDGNGDISKKEMREAVQRIYRERKALVASLKDVGSAVAKLDAVMLSVALVVILFICLLIFNRENTLASLVPVATIVLGFSFIFGHSAQTLFESLIFIFSTHVFDVGDLVMVDDQILFVKEFGLFSTTFRRVDGMEVVAPNALLASAKIVHNLRRSASMWETTNLMVAFDTPLAVIETLRQRVKAYVATNSREWSAAEINIDKMEYQNAIHLIIAMEHRPNWQDWGGRWARRTQLMRHLKDLLEELDVQYTLPIQPVLLPRGGPPQQGGSSGAPDDMFGNAGAFRAGSFGRAPVRSISSGRDHF